MSRDIKEIVGMMMHIVAGGEATIAQVQDLEFEVDDGLEPALNAAYVKLLEFAFDHDERVSNPVLDQKSRSDIGDLLIELARISEQSFVR